MRTTTLGFCKALVIGILLPVLLAQPAAALSWVQTYNGNTGTNTLLSRVLTPDQGDYYTLAKSKGVATMQAPATNVGGNYREVFWPANTPRVANSQVCATWTSESASSIQEGLAVRIVDGPTSTRAITVTKNVIYGIYWVFNVHTWDSSLAQPFTQVAQFDMANVVIKNGAFAPFPWRACAQITGQTLQFKIWLPNQEAEPAWNDAVHTGTATIPADYSAAGRTGWYVGHIPPGGKATYNNLGIWKQQ
ncbi:MAG TPA: hypothetical protein VMY99_02920 [Nevskiaceae bacterium]|nr:hypothetical protein [Nevskiaceae bacterium]